MLLKALFSNEKGTTLVVTLFITLILSLMGATAIQTSNTDIKISKNYKDSVQVLYAAEAGLEYMLDAFILGDTNGNGYVDPADTAETWNDLDGDGTIDFTQAFTNKTDIMSDAARIEVNSGTNMRAYVWVDATTDPLLVTVYSRGNPTGTRSQKEVSQTFALMGSNLINGALNNSP